MKSATTDLTTFLNSATECRIIDLYTITLLGGSILRWSAGDVPVSWGGHNYILGPAIDRTKVSDKTGVTASTIEVTIYANETDLVGSVPLIPYLMKHGLDGALVQIDRAYFDNLATEPVGTLLWFSGRFTKATSMDRTKVTLTSLDHRSLLNVNVPTDLFQPSCRWALFSTGCTLSKAAFAINGTVSGSVLTSSFGSGLSQTSGHFDQGSVKFTSGSNSGIVRAVKSYDGSGNFTLTSPLPVAPQVGDTFTAYPGCDHTKSTCQAKFNNLPNFGGFPYIPSPETSIG